MPAIPPLVCDRCHRTKFSSVRKGKSSISELMMDAWAKKKRQVTMKAVELAAAQEDCWRNIAVTLIDKGQSLQKKGHASAWLKRPRGYRPLRDLDKNDD